MNIFKSVIYSCGAKLNFWHHYSSLQCHMIFQKSFWYDLVFKKHFFLLLLSSHVEFADYYFFFFFCGNPDIYIFFQDFLINRKFKRTAFIWNRSLLYYYKSLYKSVTFGQFKASLLNKIINFLQINKWIWIWNKNLFLFFIFRRHTSILLLFLLFTACMLFLYSMYGIWVDLSFPVWRMQTENFNISSWL